MRLANKFVIQPPLGNKFKTHDEKAALMFALQNGIKHIARVKVHIPALKEYGLGEFVTELETNNADVIRICLQAGLEEIPSHQASEADVPTVAADAKPVEVLPDLNLMTKDELIEFANEKGVFADKRKSHDQIIKDIKASLAAKK